jgi:hypothetical protein
VHSFKTLLQDLASLTRNTVPVGDRPPLTILASPTPPQQRAFDLLGVTCALSAATNRSEPAFQTQINDLRSERRESSG